RVGPRFDRRLRERQAGLNRVAGLRRNQWPACIGLPTPDRDSYGETEAGAGSLAELEQARTQHDLHPPTHEVAGALLGRNATLAAAHGLHGRSRLHKRQRLYYI